MMKTSVLLVLSLGLLDFAFGNHLRIFKVKMKSVHLSTLFNICKEENKSLVTAYDEDDLGFLYNAFGSKGEAGWLGLHKRQNNVTTWSNGKSLTFNRSQVTTVDENQICEAMGNGTWEGFNCSDRKPFMCYKDNKYLLIEKEKNWCQALQFCRRHYTNLVSISNETQNEEVFKKGKNKTFWIGLQHDQWEWADKGCSTYRAWNNSRDEGNCTKMSPDLYLMLRHKCNDSAKTLCAEGKVRIQVVRQNLTWEEGLDYCKEKHTGLLWIEDQKDHEAVEQWLNNTDGKAGHAGPFWIGLKQSTLFGFWIWSDRPVSLNNWKNGKIPEMPMSHHCGVIIKINDTWKWSDEDCLNSHYFLCEEEIVFM